jgi:hypothetical protein
MTETTGNESRRSSSAKEDGKPALHIGQIEPSFSCVLVGYVNTCEQANQFD